MTPDSAPAGLRPSAMASLAAIDFGSDSDSSSEEDEPVPKKARKGMIACVEFHLLASVLEPETLTQACFKAFDSPSAVVHYAVVTTA